MLIKDIPQPPMAAAPYHDILKPETELEHQFLKAPEFVSGLHWGTPRYGHPEGEVYKHIREVLDNIDALTLPPDERRILRIVALVHDTFKYKEAKGFPRDWSRHHGVIARQFLEQFVPQETLLLEITELHDEAYYAWRMEFLHQQVVAGRLRMQHLLDRVGSARQLYYLFFKCDTRTGDKNPAPVKWFEHHIPDIQIINF
ncbi:MAG: hypothetical protein ACKOAY_00815 [Haliscomenobacter sp.]